MSDSEDAGSTRSMYAEHTPLVPSAHSGAASSAEAYDVNSDDANVVLDEDDNILDAVSPSPPLDRASLEVLVNRSGSMPSSWINLSNTILGAGMLGIPFAVSKAGFGLGIFLLVLMASLAGFGLHLLGVAGAEYELQLKAGDGKRRNHVDDFGSKTGIMFPHSATNPTASYFRFAQLTYPKARILIDAAIAIKCFGVSISYLIVVGDLMPEVMSFFGVSKGSVFENRDFWVACSAALCIPLAYLPKLDSLKYTSVIALISMVYLVTIIVYFFFHTTIERGVTKLRLFPDDPVSLLANLPIFVFAYTCHQNLPSIYNELPRAAGRRINTVVGLSATTCLVAYLVIGSFGYFSFGDAVFSDIMKNYPKTLFVSMGRMSLVLNVALSYPLQTHPARNSIDSIFFPNRQAVHQKTRRRFYVETTLIVIFSYLVAFLVKDLGVVFSIVGATGSTTICYILPGMFYFKISEHKGWTFKRAFALVMVGWGVTIMFTSLTFIALTRAGVVKTTLAG